jgi:hypothetical protein
MLSLPCLFCKPYLFGFSSREQDLQNEKKRSDFSRSGFCPPGSALLERDSPFFTQMENLGNQTGFVVVFKSKEARPQERVSMLDGNQAAPDQ